MKDAARLRAAGKKARDPERVSAAVASALDRFERKATGDGYNDARGSVKNTDEFKRVLELPRVDWTKRDDLAELVDVFTEHFRTDTGAMRLRAVQAVTLEALADCGGALGIIGVGEGKTLISYLAGPVMGAKRVAILVPAKLRDKTHRDFKELAEHWQGPESYRVFSYEMLGRVQGAELLNDYAPDLVVADEGHKLKNMDAAVTRRVVRFFRDRPDVPFLVMSGSTIERSIMNIHHLLALTLGPAKMPLPAIRTEAKAWARAVDEKTTTRGRPGALRMLTREPPTLANIRRAVGERIQFTPGVVRTVKSSVDASILVDFMDLDFPETKGVMRDLVRNRVDPNGDECLPTDVFRHVRTLCQGFYYKWDPPPPEEWMDARREWKRFVRDILDQELVGLDSELQIAQACDAGDIDSCGILDTWRAVRGAFTPNSVPVWLTDAPLRAAIEHVGKRPTIVWVEHTAVGERLSEMTGWDYYHRRGLTSKGKNVLDADPANTIIASIGAVGEGLNLQAWSHNLVMTPPANGAKWEQVLGRTHRPGQLADTVNVDVMLGHPLVLEHFAQAVRDAKFVRDTTDQPQKLLIADMTREVA